MPLAIRSLFSSGSGVLAISAALLGTSASADPVPLDAGARNPGAHPVKASQEVVPLTAVQRDEMGAAKRARVTVTSRELELPAPTTVVGATWSVGEVDDDDVIQVRSRASGTWTAWQDMPRSAEHAEDPTGGDVAAPPVTSTDPFVVVGSRAQVRVVSADADEPQVKAVVIDPGASAADASVSREASANRAAALSDGASRPSISPRSAWGADESLRKEPASYGQAQMAFIHHTAGANGYSAASVPSILRGIYAYHVKTEGWNDIGYNVLVDRFGRAWEGRAGGVDKAVVGAHTFGHNASSFGVAAIGDHSSLKPSADVLGALKAVVAWKFSIHGMPATGTVVVGGTTYNRISGHRDASGNSTACPGAALYAQLPSIRRDVAARIGPLSKVNGARSWDTDGRTDVVDAVEGGVSITRGQSPQPVAAGSTIGRGWQVLDDIVLSPDLTGDRRADIVARDPATSGLRVYRGDGRGGFGAMSAKGTGWNVMTSLVAAGDRTGDGRADLLAVRNDGALVLYVGDGAGWFGQGRVIGTGFTAYRSLVSAGDVDGDGRGELFALRNSDDRLIRWTTTSTGGLGSATMQSAGWGAISALVGPGDLDGDGSDVDLLAREATGRMRTYYSAGRIPLQRISYWGAGWGGLDHTTSGADWNGDGRPDVLARNRSTGDLVLYPGTGARDFNQPARTVSVAADTNLVRLIGDVDGDGRGDAISRDDSGNLYRLRGTATGFEAPVRIGAGWQIFSQIEPAGDYTRDGVPDILALTPEGDLRLYSLSRSWTWSWITTLSSSFTGMRSVTGTGSINADFNGDVLGLREADGALVLWRGTGPGALGESTVLATGVSDLVHVAGAGDLDGDGLNDVLATDTEGRSWLYRGTGSRLATSQRQLLSTKS